VNKTATTTKTERMKSMSMCGRGGVSNLGGKRYRGKEWH